MLTRRQQQIWEAIHAWHQSHGYAPTLDEIGTVVGINSRSTVHQHVKTLIKQGVLDESKGKPAYQIPTPESLQQAQMSLPLFGQIAAGKPIEAIDDHYDISPNELLIGPGRYALKVRGESMIDIGVMDGDFVVIQECETASNGEIVVARVVSDNETTLKRFSLHENGLVELTPENGSMESLFYPADQVQIQGRMVGLFRTCH